MKQDKRKTLFKLIENSIGSKLFRNNYFFINHEPHRVHGYATEPQSKDILKNGQLSCAFYVSSLLYLVKLISDLHTTVEGTIKDLEKSGWYKIDKPKKGAIVLWNKKKGHYHIGFYWDKNKAVSNNSFKKTPSFHHLNYQKRKILAFYFHKELE